ncbi:MAG: hypothetical protein JHC98_05205 [Thermoleophilaceae bacterium]|nr:hypothetical protein [Thermoleophilaceae bacterium]
MKRSTWIIALAILATIVTAFAAAPAGAAQHTFVETPCAGKDTDSPFWDYVGPDYLWFQGFECPTGYTFYLGQDAQLGEAEGEFRLDTMNAEIESLSARLVRSEDPPSGIEVGIQVCRFSDCGELFTGSGGIDDPIEIVQDDSDADVEIPDGANRVVVRTRCLLLLCPAQSPVILSDLEITRGDDTPPFIDLQELILVDEHDPDDEYDNEYSVLNGPTKWNNGQIYFDIGDEGGDFESPLDYVRVDIEDIHECVALFDRTRTYPDCVTLDPYTWPHIEASDLADGHHTLTLTAYNLAGVPADDSIEVKTDATPPGTPAQFMVSPRYGNWVGSRDARIDWANPGEKGETATQSGIVGFTYDVNPYTEGDNPPPDGVEDPPETYVAAVAANSLSYRFPSTGEWTVAFQTIDGAGNVSGKGETYLNIDDERLAAPELDPIAPINASDAQNGRTIDWDYSHVPTPGLCGSDYAFSSVAGFNPGEDPETPSLPGADTELTLTASNVQALSEKPQKFHLRGYSCSGVPGEIAHVPVVVDLTPPSITLAPESGTVGSSEPIALNVVDSKPNTTQSGVATVTCKINTNPVDCSQAAGVALVEGSNHLEVTATDVAGNETTKVTDYVADRTAPAGWFEDSDRADPTLIRAAVQDSGSGLALAAIEFQPSGGGPWTQIGSGLPAGAVGSAPIQLTARIPDDGQLADGEYRLRIRVRDNGGNNSVVTRTAAGADAKVRIPLRSMSRLTAGLTRSSATDFEGLARRTERYGGRPRLVGRLTGANGAAIGGALITVSSTQAGAPPRVESIATTAADGTWAVPVDAGGSREFVARFAGNLVARPTTASAKLLVRGRISLRLSKSSVRSGKQIVLSGKVFSHAAALPIRGKFVEIAFTIAGRSNGLTKTTHTDAAGRFQFVFRWKASRRAVRFKVHAISTAEPGWAYEASDSPTKKFVVKP